MELYLIRHAQSENNHLWDQTQSHHGRSDDPGITKVGKQQSVILAEFLRHTGSAGSAKAHDVQNVKGFFLTHLYTSLMIRAVNTASIAADHLGHPIVGLEDVYEEGGIYIENPETGEKVGRPGKNRAYFQKHYPGLEIPSWLDKNGWWHCRPFEIEEMRLPRARRVLEFVRTKHGNSQDRIAIFTHGGFYNKMMMAILGLSEQNNLWFSINNTAITRIDISMGEVAVIYQNRLDHLPRDLVT